MITPLFSASFKGFRRILSITTLLFSMCLIAACSDSESDKPEPTIEPVDQGITYSGTITVDQLDNTDYTENNISVHAYQPNDTQLTLIVDDVKFAEAMPIRLTMTIPNATLCTATSSPFHAYANTFSGENIIPIAMGGEFPQYTITAFVGSFDDSHLTFSMMCGEYPLTYTGTLLVEP